jgi:MFS family permease
MPVALQIGQPTPLLLRKCFSSPIIRRTRTRSRNLLKLKTCWLSAEFTAAAGLAIFITAHSPAILFGGALQAGLGLSSLYPIYIAWLSKWFGARARKVGGLMFALAAAGASTMPTLVGVVSRYSQSLRIGMMVPLIGCAAMLAVIGLLRPNTRG